MAEYYRLVVVGTSGCAASPYGTMSPSHIHTYEGPTADLDLTVDNTSGGLEWQWQWQWQARSAFVCRALGTTPVSRCAVPLSDGALSLGTRDSRRHRPYINRPPSSSRLRNRRFRFQWTIPLCRLYPTVHCGFKGTLLKWILYSLLPIVSVYCIFSFRSEGFRTISSFLLLRIYVNNFFHYL